MPSRSIIAAILIILGILVGVLLYTKNIGKSLLPQIEGSSLEELEVPSFEEILPEEGTKSEEFEEFEEFEELFEGLE